MSSSARSSSRLIASSETFAFCLEAPHPIKKTKVESYSRRFHMEVRR